MAAFSSMDGLMQHEYFQDVSNERTVSPNVADEEKGDTVQPASTTPAHDYVKLPKRESGNSEADILRGDMTLYPFYLKSIGKLSCILWALVMLFVAVTERLSGRCFVFEYCSCHVQKRR